MVRTGFLRSLMTSLSRLVLIYWLRFLGSQAPRQLIYSRLILVALTASLQPPPSAGYQSGSARVGRP